LCNYVTGKILGAQDTATTHGLDVFLHYFDLIFVCMITTIPITGAVMSQSEMLWQTVGGVYRTAVPDNFYTRLVSAEWNAIALSLGGYWAIFTLNTAFIFVVRVSNWIKLLG